MDRTTLSEQDIEILMEAMTTWESRYTRDSLGIGLMGAILGGREQSPDDRGKEMRRTVEEARDKDQRNAEVAILIKAKLIQMRREAQSRADLSEIGGGRFDR